MRADLHIHSTASDGRWPPERIVDELRAAGIGLFALADHDTVKNVSRMEELIPGSGLAYLRAVEVSTALDGHLFHLVAYGVDPSDAPLRALMRENRAKMEDWNHHLLEYLMAQGHEIDPEAYATYDYERTRGGWKLLNYMIDLGACAGVSDFFSELLVDAPYWEPKFRPPSEVTEVIRAAGGIPILAHPGVSLRHVGVGDASLAPLLEGGIAGVECYSQYHDQVTTDVCLDWCARHALLITGGSDYHGGLVGRQLGVPVVDTEELTLGPIEERIIT